MQEEEKCVITLSREEMLRCPDLLKSCYAVFGQETLINWILKKEVKKDEPVDENISEANCCAKPCDSCE